MLLKEQKNAGAMVPERTRGGSSGGRKKGALALRAVEGLKKLKEDRRLAAQAVAKVRAACDYMIGFSLLQMRKRARGAGNSVCFRFNSRTG